MMDAGFWWGVGVGMAAEFAGLLVLGRVLHTGRLSSVTVHEHGRTTRHTARRRPERTADGIRRSGENSIVSTGENVHAVIRREM
jgi:hypothetical protein